MRPYLVQIRGDVMIKQQYDIISSTLVALHESQTLFFELVLFCSYLYSLGVCSGVVCFKWLTIVYSDELA